MVRNFRPPITSFARAPSLFSTVNTRQTHGIEKGSQNLCTTVESPDLILWARAKTTPQPRSRALGPSALRNIPKGIRNRRRLLLLWCRRFYCVLPGSIATVPSPLHLVEPESAPQAQTVSSGTLGLRGRVGIEVAAIIVAALYFGREVLIPVTLAMLLSLL
jgi:hypothetical protein